MTSREHFHCFEMLPCAVIPPPSSVYASVVGVEVEMKKKTTTVAFSSGTALVTQVNPLSASMGRQGIV